MITQKIFGEIQGIQIPEIIITNKNGAEMSWLTYGATLRSLFVPDKNGKRTDIALGYDTIEEYLTNGGHFGGTIGRFANRIANASFDLNGVHYALRTKNPPNQLHGGIKGFDTKIWKYRTDESTNSVIFTCRSADGEEGFPGEVEASAAYTLTDENVLVFEYRAITTQPTPINLTNHWYFNLNGQGNGNIFDHELWLSAENYTPVNENLIPTGIAPVEGTALDFRGTKTVGKDIAAMQSTFLNGYDNNFALGAPNEMKTFARVRGPKSGICMEAATNMEGVQLYTGNGIKDIAGKYHTRYEAYSGMCLETQHYPDCVNHPDFPTAIVNPGEEYYHRVEFRFSQDA